MKDVYVAEGASDEGLDAVVSRNGLVNRSRARNVN